MGLGKLLDSTPSRVVGKSADLAQGLALAAAVGGAAVTWAVAHGLNIAMIATVAAAVVVVVVAVLAVRAVRSSSDYVIEDLEGTLTVRRVLQTDERYLHQYSYDRRQHVRATRHQMRLVCIRSHWSGQSVDVDEVASAFPEHRLLDGEVPEDDGRIYRWIYLLGPLARGQRARVGIRHVFEDAFVPMKPFYREGGEDSRVERLTVRIRFDQREAPAEAWQVVWRQTRSGTVRQEVLRRECRAVREDGSPMVVFEFRQSRPRRNCSYGFVWRWPVPEPAAAAEAAPAARRKAKVRFRRA